MEGIEIHDLRKRFGDTRALNGLDLTIRPGEIFGIAGPNGAGKSTLMKVLAGEVIPDSGEIRIDGEPWSADSAARKVAVVHQEPQLFPNLTVGQNVMVGHAKSVLTWPRVSSDAQTLLGRLAIDRFSNTAVDQCTLAVKQRTEIARALASDARCILFDEPNSALTDEESQELFHLMDSLTQVGHVVILVSHRLADLVAHCKQVAIIRDGQCPVTLSAGQLSEEAIAEELVVGRATHSKSEVGRAEAGTERDALLEVRGWTHRHRDFADIDLFVREGEVLALVGVEGSGARELLQSLAGFQPAAGYVRIAKRTGDHAIRTSTAYVAPDRRESLFANFSVGENMVSRLGRPRIARAWGAMQRRRAMSIAREFITQFAIRCRSAVQPIGSLSGGNQQKVAIASAIIARPPLLILEEPTRGVDIGSKGEIYQIMRQFVREGHGILIYCTEVPEVFEAADRVCIMSDGHLSEPLTVGTYPDVEALARDIAVREQHAGWRHWK